MDGFIAESSADMILFTQSSDRKQTEYAEDLWNKELRGGCVYGEDILEAVFI